MNLQGNKITHAFRKAKHNEGITSNNFNKVKGIILSELPQKGDMIRNMTYTEYLKDNFNNMAIEDKNLKEDVSTQLRYISSNIKKKSKLFINHSRIINYKKGNINDFYELDATSSGLQIISMLFDNVTLGELTNLEGSKITDI